jgi:hypothetical protein
MCYNFYGDNPYFKQYPGNCLDLMAYQSKMGEKGVPGGSLSAMSLICGPQSWGASCINPPLNDCAGQCPGDGTPEVSDLVGAATTGATNGIFTADGIVHALAKGASASSAGSGLGAFGGALIMGGLQVGQSFLSHHDSNKATRDANNCAS